MAEIGVPVATSAHIINCAAPAYTSKHNNSISMILKCCEAATIPNDSPIPT